jgi:hypothetical protein
VSLSKKSAIADKIDTPQLIPITSPPPQNGGVDLGIIQPQVIPITSLDSPQTFKNPMKRRNECRLRTSQKHWKELEEICDLAGMESRSKLLELILYQYLPLVKERYQKTDIRLPKPKPVSDLVEIIED